MLIFVFSVTAAVFRHRVVSRSECFCDVVVHFFPVFDEERCHLILVCVYFVYGAVIATLYAPKM